MFCFQIHAHAYCTMNEKFSILHEAKLSAVLKISSSLYSKQAAGNFCRLQVAGCRLKRLVYLS